MGKQRDPVVVEPNVENKSLASLPEGGQEISPQKANYYSMSSLQKHLVGSKGVYITTNITTTITDIKAITDGSKIDAFLKVEWFKPQKKTRFFQSATRTSIDPKYVRTRQKSKVGTHSWIKENSTNISDSYRASHSKRISAPVVLENSIGWN